jgi:vacuolar protein sorting-associated protein 13A/C
MRKIGEFYKKEAMSKVYKLVGNLTIIGSPLTLFQNVSTGIKDLVEKPI